MSIPTQFCLIWLLAQKRETDANVTSKQVKERMTSYTFMKGDIELRNKMDPYVYNCYEKCKLLLNVYTIFMIRQCSMIINI